MIDEDLIKEEAVLQAQYRLSPDVPEEERIGYIQFLMTFGKIAALSNIDKENIPGLLIEFDTIAQAYDDGYYDYARELQARFLTKLQLCRSVDGFETKWTSGSYTRAEHVENMMNKTKKKTFGDSLRRMLGHKDKNIQEEE